MNREWGLAVLLALLGLSLLVGGVAILYPWPSIPYWAVDFTVYYAAASSLADGGNPYSLADLEVHSPPGSTGGILIYAYPPLLAQTFIPLTLLPLESASRVWLAGNLLAAILSIVILLQACQWRPRPLVLGMLFVGILLSVPSVYTYLSGQASLFTLLMISLGIWLLQKDRQTWGGFAWGLAWVKPHIAGLLPYGLLLERRWKALVAFTLLTAVSLTVAFRVLPTWIEAALESLGANTREDGLAYQVTALGLLGRLGAIGWALRAFLTLGGIAILQWLARQDIGWKKLAIAQVTLGLILAPYAGRSDIVICLVPMLLILSDWHSARGPGWIAIAAWASPFACALVWIVTDWDWLFLPVVWGNIVQWLMVTAAGWTVWQSLKMRQHATS